MLRTAFALGLASTAAAHITFVSIGDWGLVGDEQSEVAAAMANTADAEGASFVLGLGDNFYEDGVTSVDDPQFKTTWEDQYLGYASLQVPWNQALGNHGYHGNASAQVAFEHELWHFPNEYYTFTETGDSGLTAQFVVMDTVTACPDFSTQVFAEEEGKEHVVAAWQQRLPQLRARAADQWSWLEDTLAASTADWLFVVGHYPVYSAAEHGDTLCLKKLLKPKLEQYNVDAYFNGHDHATEFLSDGTLSYIVSGAAAKLGEIDSPEEAELLYGEAVPGFGVHRVHADHMTTEMIGTDGKTLFKYSQPVRAKSG